MRASDVLMDLARARARSTVPVRPPARVLLGAALLGLMAAPVAAQTAAASPSRAVRASLARAAPMPGPTPAVLAPAGPGVRESAVGVGGWMTTPQGAFASSLVVPGAGQAALGLRRWILYGAAELGFWAIRLEAQADERRFRDGYRDLAWDVARVQGGERRDGGWGYYEAMSHYLSSGAFDVDPGLAGVQPEMDAATYNGVVWDLARGLFLPGGGGDPETEEYGRALAYYVEHAVGPGYLWSWVGEEAELERFRDLIDRTDAEARRATQALGLVLANHLVSAVDALIVARLRDGRGPRLESRLDAAGRDLRWQVSLSVPTSY